MAEKEVVDTAVSGVHSPRPSMGGSLVPHIPPLPTFLVHTATSCGCRYSSYGRHFTKVDLLRFSAKKLEVFAKTGDVIVDFSCGANEFLPMFKRECLSRGKDLGGRAYDIISPAHLEDFVLKSWFLVTHGDALLDLSMYRGLGGRVACYSD